MISGGVGPGGKLPYRGLRDRHHLRQRSLHVGRGMKEYLVDGAAVHGLRLDVLDIVDQRGQAALGIADDAVRHVLRGHAR